MLPQRGSAECVFMPVTQCSAPGCCLEFVGTVCLLCIGHGAKCSSILSSPPCQEAAAIMIPMLELQRLRGRAK